MSDFEVGDSYYEVLDVSESADQEEIKDARIKQIKKWHPDRGGVREKFESITAARDVLEEPEKREAYDALGHELFIERYGPRGKKSDIDPADRDPKTANTTTTNSTSSTTSSDDKGTGNASDSAQTSSNAGSTSSKNRTSSSSNSGNDSSKKDTSSRSGSRTETGSDSTSSTSNSSQGSGRSDDSGRTSSRSRSSQSNSTDQASERTSGSRGRTQSGSSSGSTASADNSTRASTTQRSERQHTPGTPHVPETRSERIEDQARSLLRTIFIAPLVLYPVTSRVVGVILSMIVGVEIAERTGVAGTGIDFAAMVALAAVLLLYIRWMPDYFGARTPRKSEYLSRLTPVRIIGLMVLAMGVASTSTFSITATFGQALETWLFLLALFSVAAVMFGALGAGLYIIGLLSGSNDNGWEIIRGTALIGIGITMIGILTPVGRPRQTVLVEVAGIETYPWPIVKELPIFILHGPMIATFLISSIVTIGVLAGVAGTLLVLFHGPQQHAKLGSFIRPTIWELTGSTLLIFWVWLSVSEDTTAGRAVTSFIEQYAVTESGLLELMWLPAAVLIVAYAIRDGIEPAYSKWRNR